MFREYREKDNLKMLRKGGNRCGARRKKFGKKAVFQKNIDISQSVVQDSDDDYFVKCHVENIVAHRAKKMKSCDDWFGHRTELRHALAKRVIMSYVGLSAEEAHRKWCARFGGAQKNVKHGKRLQRIFNWTMTTDTAIFREDEDGSLEICNPQRFFSLFTKWTPIENLSKSLCYADPKTGIVHRGRGLPKVRKYSELLKKQKKEVDQRFVKIGNNFHIKTDAGVWVTVECSRSVWAQIGEHFFNPSNNHFVKSTDLQRFQWKGKHFPFVSYRANWEGNTFQFSLTMMKCQHNPQLYKTHNLPDGITFATRIRDLFSDIYCCNFCNPNTQDELRAFDRVREKIIERFGKLMLPRNIHPSTSKEVKKILAQIS